MFGSLILFVATLFTNSPLKTLAQNLAIDMEIMDPRERNYIMAEPQSFAVDCRCLAQRYLELRDAPPISDCQLLPDHKTCAEMLAFNRAYRRTLEDRRAFSPSHYWDYSEAINEIDRLHAAWDAANDAVADYYYVGIRRRALATVREMIGPGRYFSGAMPSPVPLYCFQEIGQ